MQQNIFIEMPCFERAGLFGCSIFSLQAHYFILMLEKTSCKLLHFWEPCEWRQVLLVILEMNVQPKQQKQHNCST